MRLTNQQCKTAKYNPSGKGNKLADGGSLYLQLMASGKKVWRYNYKLNDKEKTLTIGQYPTVSLKEAREKRDEAEKLKLEGICPAEQKRLKKLTRKINSDNHFEGVAREWHENQIETWSANHASAVLRRLEVNVFPHIGHRPIADIEVPEMLAVLRKVESRGALEVAQKTKQTCGQVFRYAIATGRAKNDPCAHLKGALKTRSVKHHNYVKEHELAEFFNRLEEADLKLLTKLAIKLAMLSFVRTTELRGAKWDEIDWVKAEWRIPAQRMKMSKEHIVPLSKQALSLLRHIQLISGNHEYIFPNSVTPKKEMSENTMLYALYRSGYHNRATIHGFRSTASTILHEQGFNSDWVERQLAHKSKNKIRAVYDQSQFLNERHGMMQWWADFLETKGLMIDDENGGIHA